MTRISRPSDRAAWPGLLILLGVAALLAANWPHGSFWYDEALTAYVANDSWQTLIRWCTQVDIQVPFHYVVLRLWSALIGDSEYALRLLSALCVLLAVAATINIGRRLSKNGTGYAAGILLGAMPGIVWLGYEVRAYALALALYAWATAFLVAILDSSGASSGRRWLIAVYATLMLATLYTHYTAIAGFAAHIALILVIAWMRRSRALIGALAVMVALVGLGFAPWLPVMLARSAADRSYYVGNPILPDHSIAVMLGFKVLGREDTPPIAEPLTLTYSALMALGVFTALIPRTDRRRLTAALVGLMIAVWPVAITAGLVYFKPKLAGRYAWPAWIGFDLLVGLFVMAVARWQRLIGLAALAILVTAPWLTGQLGHPPDSDFRAAYAYLCTHGTPDDVIALRDGTLFVVDSYYGRHAPCVGVRRTVALPAAEMTNVEEALTLPDAQAAWEPIVGQNPPNIWVLSWQGDVMDPQGLAYGLLDGAGDHTLIARMFGDVRLDRYERPQPFLGDPLSVGQVVNVTPIPGGPTLHSVRVLAPPTVHAGDVITVQTWWTRGKTLQPGLRVSPRITTLDAGWTYAQVDQPPSAWKYIDDRWQPGIPVQGRYELRVGPDVPPGQVAIRYVLYDATNAWTPIILKIGEVTVAASPP